ncbi:hypothetical protein GCM10007962_14000 [Yeosuana aromativorans]|uniref:Uncharacterized protein n=1 Tax=Yeosuana aromativorans TaxID=288019 RepID=A0A8J3BQS6_9FLAO|nr:hypothetical protein [Yeosuana aromativorans]GGK21075.1 hypothetical protein GCM10007962_14000 [Yeosuana aromativorans]
MNNSINWFILISSTLFFWSCSEDSNNLSKEDYFIDVAINNTILLSNNTLGKLSHNKTECQTGENIFFTLISILKTSEYFIEPFLATYKESNNFTIDTTQKSNVIEYDFSTSECLENFDFCINFLQNDETLSLDKSKNNFSNITAITYVKDLGEFYSVYAISGNFNLTFLDSNQQEIKVTGEYKTPIQVLK